MAQPAALTSTLFGHARIAATAATTPPAFTTAAAHAAPPLAIRLSAAQACAFFGVSSGVSSGVSWSKLRCKLRCEGKAGVTMVHACLFACTSVSLGCAHRAATAAVAPPASATVCPHAALLAAKQLKAEQP